MNSTHGGTAAATASVPEPPDAETLSRAALTFCLDSADALMFATIKGARSARLVLQLVIDSRPHAPSDTAAAARRTLDETFITGIIRWGRKVTPQGMDAFHTALAGWHRRLDRLPTLDISTLGGWFTAEGTQWIIAPHSPFWPHQLADLSVRKDWAAPLCLWGRGDPGALVCCDKPLAVVGSRGVGDYGRSVARSIAQKAASQGHLVVSGGAMGTDAAAHWGALSAGDESGDGVAGRTVAVFAGGLNHIGPQCNRMLFDRIVVSGGALISELCPDTTPEGRRFLLRNRIIAALSSTVVVAQARLRSGALNTANWAAELGREVYAVPGDIDAPHHAGCNRLIHEQRAVLLPSSDAEGICHAPHRPMTPFAGMNRPHDPPRDADAPAMPQDREIDERHAADPRDDVHQLVYTAIRRCRRRKIAPTAEAIAARMAEDDAWLARTAEGSGDPGGDIGDETGLCGERALASVMALLGDMELNGLVTVSGGVFAIPARPRNPAAD